MFKNNFFYTKIFLLALFFWGGGFPLLVFLFQSENEYCSNALGFHK